MNEKLLQIASDILGISVDDIQENSKPIPEIDAFFCWNPIRGGLQMIINDAEEKLVMGSSFSYDKILTFFNEGKRN